MEIDEEFEAQRTSATLRGDLQRVTQIAAKQMINDQAYFVLCWGQLELAIDDACRNAIRRRQASGNWAVRRAWDLYNPDDRRLSGLRFEDRTALVLDRSGAQRSPLGEGDVLLFAAETKSRMESYWQMESKWETWCWSSFKSRARFKPNSEAV